MTEACKKTKRAEAKICEHLRDFIDGLIKQNPAYDLYEAKVVVAALVHFERSIDRDEVDLKELLGLLRLPCGGNNAINPNRGLLGFARRIVKWFGFAPEDVLADSPTPPPSLEYLQDLNEFCRVNNYGRLEGVYRSSAEGLSTFRSFGYQDMARYVAQEEGEAEDRGKKRA